MMNCGRSSRDVYRRSDLHLSTICSTLLKCALALQALDGVELIWMCVFWMVKISVAHGSTTQYNFRFISMASCNASCEDVSVRLLMKLPYRYWYLKERFGNNKGVLLSERGSRVLSGAFTLISPFVESKSECNRYFWLVCRFAWIRTANHEINQRLKDWNHYHKILSFVRQKFGKHKRNKHGIPKITWAQGIQSQHSVKDLIIS